MLSTVAKSWKLRTRTLAFGPLPLLMGIVNVTPDSFSDGGRFADAEAAVEHGLRLVAEGVDILDIGGESTRPGSESVSAQEELRRVLPVVGELCQRTSVPISVDTSKAIVAKHAIHAGAEIINDISALSADREMLPLAAEAGCGVCLMHMQGTPRTMQHEPVYEDVVGEVCDYLRSRRDVATAAGIEPERIAIDPGVGFGKTTAHNLDLLTNIARLHELGCPLLVGHSRKRFMVATLSQLMAPSPLHLAEIDRAAGTIGVALAMARRGVQVLRVHDVAAVRQALLMFQATGGLG